MIDQPYSLTTVRPFSRDKANALPVLGDTDYESWLRRQALRSRKVSEELVSFGGDSKRGLQFEDDFLRKQVPVLCLILSKGRDKARAVKETWGLLNMLVRSAVLMDLWLLFHVKIRSSLQSHPILRQLCG